MGIFKRILASLLVLLMTFVFVPGATKVDPDEGIIITTNGDEDEDLPYGW